MREQLLEFLNTQYDAMDIISINDAMGLTTADELKKLQQIINELIDDMEIYETKKKKYILYDKLPNFRKGKMQVNKKGFGFLVLENEDDIHIGPNNLNYALDGDIALVEITSKNDQRPEGRVIKILKRDLKNIVGIMRSDGKNLFFDPNEKKDMQFIIDEKDLKQCVEGEIVVLSLLDNMGKNKYIANISARLGHKDDPGIDIKQVAAKYGIYDYFPEDVIKQVEGVATSVTDEDKKNRRDLTNILHFTIDGKDTKDVDDAISLIKVGEYYILRVSIADVSYYVEKDTPIDIEALKRGTSNYLADSVIPMLDHKLSNGICSLNPDVLRCAITCEMKIDAKGHVVDADIYPSIIKSAKKMTYEAVNNIYDNNIVEEGYEPFVDTLNSMLELASIIRSNKVKRGYIDFDLEEAKIIVDENKKVIDIKKRTRGDAEKVIEDFMIIANETVAQYIYNMGLPFIYRVHAEPNPEKIETFINICSLLGNRIHGKFTTMNPKMFQKLLSQVNTGEDKDEILRGLALRSMAKAYYSKENIGHFGLASQTYTHFTSPIRRYPDLQVHRLLRAFLFNHQIDTKTIDYWNNVLEAIARQCSDREIAAIEAEREVEKMKMAEYMEDHVNEEFEGVISGVTGFGMFVRLDNLVEGLIPVSSLKGDYFEYVEELMSLIGKSTKKRYTIGDRLKIKCVAASKETGQIDFELVLEKQQEEKNYKKELKKNGNK